LKVCPDVEIIERREKKKESKKTACDKKRNVCPEFA